MAKNKPVNKKKISGPRLAALIITIAILLGLVVSLLAGSGFFVRIQNGAKTEHFKVSGSMMAYYANTYVNNWINNYYIYVLYGMFDPSAPYSEQLVPGETNMTFYDYFVSGTKNMVEQYLNYCEAAMDDPDFNYSQTESDAEAYAKETVDALKSNAKAAGMSVDTYIRNALNQYGGSFGEYVNVNDIKKAMVIEYIAAKYASFVYDRYDGLTDDAREDRYFKEHFDEFIVAEYIIYTVASPETVDATKYESKTDEKYLEAVEKANSANKIAKEQHLKDLKKLATAAKEGLEAYKTVYLELKFDTVFEDTYNTLVKNWSSTDKPSADILSAYKDEFKSQLIDAAVKGLDALPKAEDEEAAPASEEPAGSTEGGNTSTETKPSKWDTNKETFSKNVIAALKKVITDNTKKITYTLDSDLGKFFFTNVKKDFGIDENAETITDIAKVNGIFEDPTEYTSDDDKAIGKYAISQYFVTKEAYKDEEVVRDVSHILFKVDSTGSNGAYKTKDEAKAAAEKLLAEIQASAVDGKVDEDKFIEFAAVTHDSNVSYTLNKDGQLLGQTTKLLKNYTDWVFAATEVGQLGLIETEYGWHIMYYGGEDISWRKTAHSKAISEDVTAWYDGLTYNVVINDGIFDDIMK